MLWIQSFIKLGMSGNKFDVDPRALGKALCSARVSKSNCFLVPEQEELNQAQNVIGEPAQELSIAKKEHFKLSMSVEEIENGKRISTVEIQMHLSKWEARHQRIPGLRKAVNASVKAQKRQR